MIQLNSKHIAILQAIKEGKGSTKEIVKDTDLSVNVVQHYQDELAEENYIKCAKTYASDGNGWNYHCFMQPKGNVALEDPNLLIHPNQASINQTYISANSIVFINSANGTVQNFSQNIEQNLSEVKKLITSIRQSAEAFPEEQRDEVNLALEDLETDLNNSEKHHPKRIQSRIKRLWRIASLLGVAAIGVVAFTKDVLELAEKLGIPIEIQQIDESVPQLPPSP